ncbi:phosphotransferase-like protein [Candidatus Tisiphia endosymbiont of Neophilaenus lineatus]|uniref:phosphotransferase-like protein n=1 Tax=Candidatus Tisiphia endosymbiont of Neophilaenus lineatus TaxID=3139336 RepID=UPI0035CAFC6F
MWLSGKTSIARAIQYLSKDSWLTCGIDTFISMTPLPCSSDDKPDVIPIAIMNTVYLSNLYT